MNKTTALQTFAQARSTLAEIIRNQNTALVIGAGASASSGGPVARVLVTKLAERFPLAGIDIKNQLFNAGNDVGLTAAYGRQDLLEYIKALYCNLQPSESYKQLPRVRWRAIYTTNYDDLIEKAYTASGRVQDLQPVDVVYGAHTLARDNHVMLFYLMGSVKAAYDHDAAPVATWSDYHRTIQQRAPILRTLYLGVPSGGWQDHLSGLQLQRFRFGGIA